MPPPPPSREEVEIRKLDAFLALTDARIQLVTPIPGQQAGGPGAAAGAGGGVGGSSEDADGDEKDASAAI